MGRASDARQRIIDSARGLIYQRSYADVGVQEICDRAEVKKGSFYHFFPSKRDLTLAVLDECHGQSQALIARAFDPKIPPLARLKRLVELNYEAQANLKKTSGHMPGCPYSNLACELSTQDETIRQHLDGIIKDLIRPIESALIEAVQAGELPGIDTHRSAEAVFAYWEGVVLLAKTRNDPELILKLGMNTLPLLEPEKKARKTSKKDKPQ